jgi:hypothetical protein
MDAQKTRRQKDALQSDNGQTPGAHPPLEMPNANREASRLASNARELGAKARRRHEQETRHLHVERAVLEAQRDARRSNCARGERNERERQLQVDMLEVATRGLRTPWKRLAVFSSLAVLLVAEALLTFVGWQLLDETHGWIKYAASLSVAWIFTVLAFYITRREPSGKVRVNIWALAGAVALLAAAGALRGVYVFKHFHDILARPVLSLLTAALILFAVAAFVASIFTHLTYADQEEARTGFGKLHVARKALRVAQSELIKERRLLGAVEARLGEIDAELRARRRELDLETEGIVWATREKMEFYADNTGELSRPATLSSPPSTKTIRRCAVRAKRREHPKP